MQCEPLVAFIGRRDGQDNLFTGNLSGGIKNLTQSASAERNPRWSHDGRRILFDRDDDVWVINSDGTGVRNLTQDSASLDFDGRWSPDDQTVAFRRGPGDIYLIGIDGLNARALVDDEKNQQQAVWSNDGSKLVYYNLQPAGVRELRVVNADGTEDKLLGDGTEPRYSPTNDVIAYQAPAVFPDIRVIDINGVSSVNLTNSGNVLERDHIWSHDGAKIAWASSRDGDLEIYSMNADGSSPTNLSQNGAQELSPSWSGDGSTIAFQSNRDGGERIWLMNADGTNPRRLTSDNVVERTPSFSPCAE